MTARRAATWVSLLLGLLGIVITNPALIERTTFIGNAICGNTLSVALGGVKLSGGELNQPLNTEFMAQCQTVARAEIWPWVVGWAVSVAVIVGALVAILVSRRRARRVGASAGS